MNACAFYSLLKRYWSAKRSFDYASHRGLIGQEFGRFGRQLGWVMLLRGKLRGISRILVPVHITRYFEFAFAKENIGSNAKQCLDVSSPDLFSLFMSTSFDNMSIRLSNPDRKDVEITKESRGVLKLPNLQIDNLALHELIAPEGGYDCIWAISVVEHIDGAYDDRRSMQMLYELLAKGGRLIVTVPVSRSYWIEYRDVNHYGTQSKHGERHFFQRFYDRAAIWDRLLRPIGCEPSRTAWFGEKTQGRFHDYIKRWLKEGLDCTVNDPREIVDHYQLFEDWSAMPGVGVCGLAIDKS